MKKLMLPAAALSVALLSLHFATSDRAASTPFGGEKRLALAQGIVAEWSRSSRLMGEAMLEAYGPPDALSIDGLGWRARGRWKTIVVRERPEDTAAGVLEQSVDCRMPPDRLPELAAFEEVRVSPGGRSMTASSDAEALNYLALNLAHGIGSGFLDAARARASYERAVELSRAGKTSPLMEGLLFPPPLDEP